MEKNIMERFRRHGDVGLHPIDILPSEARLIKETNSYTAALGEATGHSHIISSEMPIAVYEMPDGVRYLEIKKEARISHEEHKALTILPGVFRIGGEIEEDPYTEEMKKVID